MKIFDMHIHTGEGPVEQNQLLDRMEQSGVWGGVLLSPAPDCTETSVYALPYPDRLKNILEWTKDQDGRLFPALWIHPFEKNVCDIVRDAAQSGIRAIKMLCDTYPVYCKEAMTVLETIQEYSLPVIFHSGILWSGTDSSQYNRPVNWEAMLKLKSVRFSMGHCSWPWHDECIAVYGKFLNSYNLRKSSEMFFDITPGTPKIYREDLLTKLYTVGYDVENNIMFGTDSVSTEYDPGWVSGWLAKDREIFDKIGVTQEQREKLYNKNVLRFLNNEEVEHVLPQMNR